MAIHGVGLGARTVQLSSDSLYDRRAPFLDMAERHVALGEQHVLEQRELVALLELSNAEMLPMAIRLLSILEEMQRAHISHRDRLKDLAKIGGSGSGQRVDFPVHAYREDGELQQPE